MLSRGIEPLPQASEACILSVELRERLSNRQDTSLLGPPRADPMPSRPNDCRCSVGWAYTGKQRVFPTPFSLDSYREFSCFACPPGRNRTYIISSASLRSIRWTTGGDIFNLTFFRFDVELFLGRNRLRNSLRQPADFFHSFSLADKIGTYIISSASLRSIRCLPASGGNYGRVYFNH